VQNFTFYNPTRIHFGKGEIAKLTEEITPGTKVLLAYGGGSIKKNGVYDQVVSALSGCEIIEFSGIEANPDYDTCLKAVDVVKNEGCTFILAVGGGSIIDACKFIAAAVYFEGDTPWDMIASGVEIKKALPLASVLTLPATGSEMNIGSVISRRATGEKRAFRSYLVAPVFSILDPTTTFTLPERQVRNGVVDAFTHVMEQYLTYPVNAPLQDRFAEGILQTLIEEGPKTLANPEDYDARANMMWCATMALNLLIGAGVPQDWATHMLGHEFTAKHGLDHAQTLAIILPNMMDYKRDKKQAKLLQYGERVWNITKGSDEERISAAIEKTRAFFESLQMPTRLSQYEIDDFRFDDMVAQLEKNGFTALGEHGDITLADSRKIYEACV
jgi:NADP-dependent alcohol dehydrogenase